MTPWEARKTGCSGYFMLASRPWFYEKFAVSHVLKDTAGAEADAVRRAKRADCRSGLGPI
jgi:hypothetical protein